MLAPLTKPLGSRHRDPTHRITTGAPGVATGPGARPLAALPWVMGRHPSSTTRLGLIDGPSLLKLFPIFEIDYSIKIPEFPLNFQNSLKFVENS
jgi:hypothetical protein